MIKTIIKVTKEDGSFGYVKSINDTIEISSSVTDALQMDFQTTLSVSLALATLKIPHSMISSNIPHD